MSSICAAGSQCQGSNSEQNQAGAGNSINRANSVVVVGIGPGSYDDLTPRALAAIKNADVIVGYKKYVELISELTVGKKVVDTGMKQEIDRAQAALALAMQGHAVAVISSGDPGIYGMAGLMLELAGKIETSVRPSVSVVAGLSAVGASAAILGAPLMHDFAVISLSDLLTPWEVIERRVDAAAQADFVIALYNPKSTKRVSQIEQVRDICLKYRKGSTPVGIVRHATRSQESKELTDLATFTQKYIDMFSLVIIGNSQTYIQDGVMITPRGYRV